MALFFAHALPPVHAIASADFTSDTYVTATTGPHAEAFKGAMAAEQDMSRYQEHLSCVAVLTESPPVRRK